MIWHSTTWPIKLTNSNMTQMVGLCPEWRSTSRDRIDFGSQAIRLKIRELQNKKKSRQRRPFQLQMGSGTPSSCLAKTWTSIANMRSRSWSRIWQMKTGGKRRAAIRGRGWQLLGMACQTQAYLLRTTTRRWCRRMRVWDSSRPQASRTFVVDRVSLTIRNNLVHLQEEKTQGCSISWRYHRRVSQESIWKTSAEN